MADIGQLCLIAIAKALPTLQNIGNFRQPQLFTDLSPKYAPKSPVQLYTLALAFLGINLRDVWGFD